MRITKRVPSSTVVLIGLTRQLMTSFGSMRVSNWGRNFIELVFSWFADAGAWPEHPGSGFAVLDQELVGPLRLLYHVERMLGLRRPEVAAVKRIAIYRRKIEAAGTKRFWSESLDVNSWSATRELLVMARRTDQGRLAPERDSRAAGSLISQRRTGGPTCRSDAQTRPGAVIHALGETPRLPLDSVTLVDARAVLPVGWRALLERLGALLCSD